MIPRLGSIRVLVGTDEVMLVPYLVFTEGYDTVELSRARRRRPPAVASSMRVAAQTDDDRLVALN